MVLAVGAPYDDGTEDLVSGKAEIAQEIEREQLEPIAVVPVAPEGLFERSPVIDGPVGPVVGLRLLLGPIGNLAGQGAGARLPAWATDAGDSPLALRRSRSCQPRILGLQASSTDGSPKYR
jgi:hypothetical protein